MSDFKLLGFSKSHLSTKKYDAILKNKLNDKIKLVPFGSSKHEHFKDLTPLKLYSYLDHNNTNRKINYYKRHKIDYPFPSADYFSKRYLW